MAMAVLNDLPTRFHSLIAALDALDNRQKNLGLDYDKSRLLPETQRCSLYSAGAAKFSQSALNIHLPKRIVPFHLCIAKNVVTTVTMSHAAGERTSLADVCHVSRRAYLGVLPY